MMKPIHYISTRTKGISVPASQAILKGISDDGGLFVPEEFPVLDKNIETLAAMDYKSLAYEVMKVFLTDFTEEELKGCIDGAYDEKFDTPEIAPVVKKGEAYFLELFHGKTLAFKDMALSILPYLMKTAAKKNGIDKEIVILTATSGDTGKAALEGFADVEGTRIMVFFPEDGVSPVQKLQMTTQEGKNTCVAGIKGNFDDAQSAVKKIFTDPELKKAIEEKGFLFSSANSINIGRLVPQVVYYFYAYGRLVRSGEIQAGEAIQFTVPTGNFGNILAGYYAMKMGLPIHKLLCASNDNKVLYDFFKTGTYNKNREFILTASPSMDILISSNLERLLYHLSSQEETKKLMESLSAEGKYSLSVKEEAFIGEYATEEECFSAILKLYKETGYIMDTHTAVAYASLLKYQKETKDFTKTVIVSTASPYKFTKDVLTAIDSGYASGDAFALMKELQKLSGVPIPAQIDGIEARPVLHKNVCEKDKIKEFVEGCLFGNQ